MADRWLAQKALGQPPYLHGPPNPITASPRRRLPLLQVDEESVTPSVDELLPNLPPSTVQFTRWPRPPRHRAVIAAVLVTVLLGGLTAVRLTALRDVFPVAVVWELCLCLLCGLGTYMALRPRCPSLPPSLTSQGSVPGSPSNSRILNEMEVILNSNISNSNWVRALAPSCLAVLEMCSTLVGLQRDASPESVRKDQDMLVRVRKYYLSIFKRAKEPGLQAPSFIKLFDSVEFVLRVLRPCVRRGVIVKNDIPVNNFPGVRIDDTALTTVLFVLLQNAMVNTEQGSIVITAKRLATTENTEDRVEVTLTDTGRGFSDAQVASMFMSTGLRFVKQLVEANGGRISFQRSKKTRTRGSSVKSTLPPKFTFDPDEPLGEYPRQSTGTDSADTPGVAQTPAAFEAVKCTSFSLELPVCDLNTPSAGTSLQFRRKNTLSSTRKLDFGLDVATDDGSTSDQVSPPLKPAVPPSGAWQNDHWGSPASVIDRERAKQDRPLSASTSLASADEGERHPFLITDALPTVAQTTTPVIRVPPALSSRGAAPVQPYVQPWPDPEPDGVPRALHMEAHTPATSVGPHNISPESTGLLCVPVDVPAVQHLDPVHNIDEPETEYVGQDGTLSRTESHTSLMSGRRLAPLWGAASKRASFCSILPLERAASPARQRQGHAQTKYVIVIVSSNPAVYERLEQHLTHGTSLYEVRKLSTAGATLELMRTVHPDLILLDFDLEDGALSLLEEIRHRGGLFELPVLVVGHLDDDAVFQAFDAGANDFIAQPSQKALLARVRTQLHIVTMSLCAARFVPNQFLFYLNRESLLDVDLGDNTQRIMTVMFCDIRGFTSLSETMSPSETFGFINNFLAKLGPEITKHDGFIDKYIGDAIMALFGGAPINAVKAAVGMQRALKELNAERQGEGKPEVSIGIGIHTGDVILGTVGFEDRMDTSVLSDTVNLASRLEGLTKEYHCNVIISAETHDLLEENPFETRFLGETSVKGKQEAVCIWEVVGYAEAGTG